MRLVLASLFLMCAFRPEVTNAKDFGVHGQTYPIRENNLLTVIESRLQAASNAGKLTDLQQNISIRVQNNIQQPLPVEGLRRTETARSYAYDPTLVVEEDIKDHKGNLIARKGTRLNPLDYLNWGTPILLIDGDDQEQVRWAANTQDKLVLARGAPLELEKQLQKPVYFDQGGRIVKKFGISQVPCRISQAGKVLLIEELEPITRKGETT